MRILAIVGFLLVMVFPAAALEQPGAGQPPIEVVQNSNDIDVNADGSFKQVSEVAYRPLDAQGLKGLQHLTLSYTSGFQNLTIQNAYTLKSDGTIIKVAPTNILYGRGASSMPGYQDIMTVTIVFPDVEIGDEVVLATTLDQKVPWIPGAFATGIVFERNVATRNADFSVSAPSDYPLVIDMAGLEGGDAVTSGGKTRHHWTFRNDQAQPPEPGAVIDGGRLPHVFVSSFADYSAVARAASGWFKDKATVTPEIQHLADQLTMSTTDPREQARTLYDWVSAHISYVQIVLGAGGFVPHAASEVLRNGYGDCKDHVMLLQALLAAKGIDSSPVLIFVGADYHLPAAATPYAFNHVITYIPQFHLFADSTAQFAPFGILPLVDAGRPVILTATGEQMRTPVTGSADNQISVVEKIRISPNGDAEGDSRISSTGPVAVDLRSMMASISASAEPDYFRQVLGPGAEGTIYRGDSATLSPSYSYSSHYRENQAATFPGPGGLPPGLGYKPFYFTDYIAGALPAQRSQPYACPSIYAQEDTTIELPAGVTILSLPRSGVMHADGVTLEVTARKVKGNEAHELTTLRIDHPQAVCTPEYYNSVHDSLQKMVAALRQEILYQ